MDTALINFAPAAGIAALFLLTLWSIAAHGASRRWRPFETRRTLTLRQAARAEQALLDARERRRHPGRSEIVFLGGEWERRWWCDRFSVSPEALQAAVRQVGPMASDVERYFGTA